MCTVEFFLQHKREWLMFTSQREKWADHHIIALVELDMQRRRVRLVLEREAIGERLRELEHPWIETPRESPNSNPNR